MIVKRYPFGLPFVVERIRTFEAVYLEVVVLDWNLAFGWERPCGSVGSEDRQQSDGDDEHADCGTTCARPLSEESRMQSTSRSIPQETPGRTMRIDPFPQSEPVSRLSIVLRQQQNLMKRRRQILGIAVRHLSILVV